MLKYKPEEIINYIKLRLTKENKVKSEINFRNNNLLKNISLYNTLNKLNVTTIPTNNTNILINKKEEIKEASNVLTLKKIKLNNKFNFFQRKNKINIDALKKQLNLKKKKYNKGLDFCSYFLQQKKNYYINVLNEGITNNFISFYSKADKYYSNILLNNNNNNINIDLLKINKIKYPLFIVKAFNDKSVINFGNKKKEDNINIYNKCVAILNKEDNKDNIYEDKKIFLKGINHNIRYDLENYLNNKIKLIDLNDKDNNLFIKGHYLNKACFQFVKKINVDEYNNNNDYITIDKSCIIPDKKNKFSFNEPRMMYPLYIKGIFDKINVYNEFSFYKKNKFISENSDLNLIFEKNMQRPKEYSKMSKLFKEFNKSENCDNILNGYYLLNPLQQSINNKELNDKIKIAFLPKKLNKNLNSILGSKFNYNKYIRKRNYIDLINSKKKPKNIINNNNINKKLILLSEKTSKNYINNPDQYIILNNNKSEFDILFDINICAKIYFTSEFYDQFQYNGYNSICDLINKNYLYYNKFYIYLIDDEKIKENINALKADKIVEFIYKIINDKFSFLSNDKYNFDVIAKIVDNPHLINYEINLLYDELVNNNFNNEFSVYNNHIYNKILNEIKNSNDSINKGNDVDNVNVNPKIKFNLYEEFILNSIHNPELKEEFLNMINKKYSKLNII